MTSHLAAPATGGGRPAPVDLAGARVVVGFDQSPASVAAVRWAAAQALRLGSELVVLSACEPPALTPAGAGDLEVLPDLWSASRFAASRGVDVARERNPEGRIAAVGVIGGPAGELVARSSGAGLVVVGRNRRNALQAAVLGSVSFAVAMHARCPVVVVGEGPVTPSPLTPVVVGVDGSRAARGAVALAAEFARVWQAPLHVVSTWHAPAPPAWPDLPVDGSVITASTQPYVAAARSAVDDAVVQASTAYPQLAVTGSVVEGRADDVLVDLSRHAGLVVVGSRGHGGFAGLMMGSVSHAVMRRATSPVAVVRRGSL